MVFANSGEGLWRRLRSGLEALLLGLWGAGALDGASAAEAFAVRCDRSTVTQNDLDAGRVIARIELSVAHPIERITVVLAMDEGGQVSLVSARAAAEVTA
jgi:phage tail sheath protein FI